MLFNSLPFLGFIALFFAFWPLAQKRNTSKWIWICSMSFFFYGWWDWRFLFLLVGTGAIDYIAGHFIYKGQDKKAWLWFSLVSNIGSLLIFKYSYWLAGVLDGFFFHLNLHTDFRHSIPEFTLVLPVGISFYTFNSMSYTIDLYKGKTSPARNMLHFFAFISFFPHLVAGPIIRARDILQQLSAHRRADAVEIMNGLKTCIWGFFQKMVIADNLAVFVNFNFNDVYRVNDSLTWWIAMLAFSFQIYFDFNGYSTIARGIAKLCGIHFRLNFNHPYLAHSFSNFWQRWHISLSSFFRDYVYIPLGGNRRGPMRNVFNRWFTMLLSGLWHGANLTFLAWGALHAFYLSLEKLLAGKRDSAGKSRHGSRMINRITVFIAVLLAWVFFRSSSMEEAFFIIRTMFSMHQQVDVKTLLAGNVTIWLVVAFLLEFSSLYRSRISSFNSPLMQVAVWGLLIAIIVYFRGPEQQFIYFQF